MTILLSFFGSLALFGAVNYIFILVVARYVGGSVKGSAKAAVQLMIWTFTVVQAIVQVREGGGCAGA